MRKLSGTAELESVCVCVCVGGGGGGGGDITLLRTPRLRVAIF